MKRKTCLYIWKYKKNIEKLLITTITSFHRKIKREKNKTINHMKKLFHKDKTLNKRKKKKKPKLPMK